jgi:hypothetical protein
MKRFLSAEATALCGSQQNNRGESAGVSRTVNVLRPTIYDPKQIIAIFLKGYLHTSRGGENKGFNA